MSKSNINRQVPMKNMTYRIRISMVVLGLVFFPLVLLGPYAVISGFLSFAELLRIVVNPAMIAYQVLFAAAGIAYAMRLASAVYCRPDAA